MSGWRLMALLVPTAFALCGCATVTTGTRQPIEVLVQGADVSHCTLQRLGYAPVDVESGKAISIPRGDAPLTAQCASTGFDTTSVTVQAQVQDRAKYELPMGMLIDYLSGARYAYPSQVTVTLTPAAAWDGKRPLPNP